MGAWLHGGPKGGIEIIGALAQDGVDGLVLGDEIFLTNIVAFVVLFAVGGFHRGMEQGGAVAALFSAGGQTGQRQQQDQKDGKKASGHVDHPLQIDA